MKSKLSFIGLFAMLFKWRKLVFINVFSVGIISLVISFLLPKWFEAEAIVLPPQKQSLMLNMGGIGDLASSFMGPSGFELPMLATRSDVYTTILESKRVLKEVIEQNDLMDLYKAKNLDVCIKKLKKHAKIDIGRDGSIHIKFEAKDPQKASTVSNTFVKLLNDINMETNQKTAGSTRIFIEERLNETKNNLAKAEVDLMEFQKFHNAISIEDQIKVTIEGSAQFIAQLMSLKIELGVLKQNYNSSYQSVKDIEIKIQEIEKILNGINSDKQTNLNDIENTGVFLPLKAVPELGLEYARLFRQFKIEEILFELLTQQFVQSRIKEKENTPTIQVLQYAEPPDYKSKPKKGFIVLLSVFFAFGMSVFLIFLFTYFERIKNENSDEFDYLQYIQTEMKKDLNKIIPFKNK